MILTDTHTHIYSDAFEEDKQEMMQRAIDACVTRFFVPAVDSETTQSMYDIEKAFPKEVFLMMGLHPTHVKDNYKDELKHVKEELAKRKFYGVGEIGIDLYWDKKYVKEQQEAFEQQIIWAKKYKLPIVIHCRDAFEEVFEVLEKHKGSELFGIFHCFTGNYKQAIQAIDCGMKLGIGGVVTFKNGKIDKFLNEIPLKNIVLETDAPYLAPAPFRGKRNESSYLLNVAHKLAEVYNTSVEEIAKITTQNSKDVFGI